MNINMNSTEPIQMGDKTQHQDQAITLQSFNTIKTMVSRLESSILVLLFDIYFLLVIFK